MHPTQHYGGTQIFSHPFLCVFQIPKKRSAYRASTWRYFDGRYGSYSPPIPRESICTGLQQIDATQPQKYIRKENKGWNPDFLFLFSFFQGEKEKGEEPISPLFHGLSKNEIGVWNMNKKKLRNIFEEKKKDQIHTCVHVLQLQKSYRSIDITHNKKIECRTITRSTLPIKYK